MKLMLGTAQFGRSYGIANKTGKVPKEEVSRILELSKNNGISFIDTGNDYGVSENLIGDISVELNTNFNVVTKLYLDLSKCDVGAEIIKSMERLKTSRLFGLLAHSPSDLLGPHADVLWDALVEAKEYGFTQHIGVSAGTVEQIVQILDKYPIGLIQIPVNLFDQRFETSGLIKELSARNVKIHVRSIFLQGLLLMNAAELGEYFSDLKPSIDNLQNIAAEYHMPVEKIAIEYIKSLGVDNIVVGTDNLNQLENLINIYNMPFNKTIDFRQFAINDERFINPGRWPVGGWKS